MSNKNEILDKLNKKGLIKNDLYDSELKKLKKESEEKDCEIEMLFHNLDFSLISFA